MKIAFGVPAVTAHREYKPPFRAPAFPSRIRQRPGSVVDLTCQWPLSGVPAPESAPTAGLFGPKRTEKKRDPLNHYDKGTLMMNKQIAVFFGFTLTLGIAQGVFAAGVDTRIERRHDVVESTADRVEDKQDFREERRDCVGDGPDCRSDNRQDKRQDTVERVEDRVDDRQDRR
jgi:hypothetical protein